VLRCNESASTSSHVLVPALSPRVCVSRPHHRGQDGAVPGSRHVRLRCVTIIIIRPPFSSCAPPALTPVPSPILRCTTHTYTHTYTHIYVRACRPGFRREACTCALLSMCPHLCRREVTSPPPLALVVPAYRGPLPRPGRPPGPPRRPGRGQEVQEIKPPNQLSPDQTPPSSPLSRRRVHLSCVFKQGEKEEVLRRSIAMKKQQHRRRVAHVLSWPRALD